MSSLTVDKLINAQRSKATQGPSAASAALAKQLSAVFARLCPKKSCTRENSPSIEQTLQLVFEALEAGKICLDMSNAIAEADVSSVTDKQNALTTWKNYLIDAGVASSVGGFTPLIIDGDQLYFARYHLYHTQLQQRLTQLASQSVELSNEGELANALTRLFPTCEFKLDWQKVAAALALKKRLCVLSGGPGTGKTTTVLRLLAALCTAQSKLRIRLAAPTGKAAARMQESIQKEVGKLDCDQAIKDQFMTLKASTLHRLLGYKPNSVNFRHHAGNPLAVDVLVIDESSMIDSAMMAKCLDALPVNARIILLGDKDQLTAVDPGSPFAEICSQFGFSHQFADELTQLSGQSVSEFAVGQPKALGDNLVFLKHSYRFGDSSGIGQLAKLINAGKNEDALELLRNPANTDIGWQDYQPAEFRRSNAKKADPLIQKVKAGFAPYLASLANPKQVTDVFAGYSQFCLLTATHKGFSGRIDTNLLCQKALGFPADKTWYHGRPVMISQNDYQTGLYNGDVGICLDLTGDGQLRVYFPMSDGFKDYTPSRIPAHETAFAMTVHKSQGSEFSRVLFLLPDSDSRVFNRALVYTAITRAKEMVELWGQGGVLLGVGL